LTYEIPHLIIRPFVYLIIFHSKILAHAFICIPWNLIFFGDTGVWTRGLMLIREVLCHLNHSASPCIPSNLKIEFKWTCWNYKEIFLCLFLIPCKNYTLIEYWFTFIQIQIHFIELNSQIVVTFEHDSLLLTNILFYFKVVPMLITW
jgi:hypothetical protein